MAELAEELNSGTAVSPLPPEIAFDIWGYDLRGPGMLEPTARIVEEGGNADLNGPLLWDHPEWLEGWVKDGEPYTPPLWRALPYAPGNPWGRT